MLVYNACTEYTMASHYIKSPMGHDVQVCIEDHSYGDGHDACTPYGTLHVHAATYTCTCTYSRRQIKSHVLFKCDDRSLHWCMASGLA